MSYDDYNLACIVVLPPYQKKGYGMLLIEFSASSAVRLLAPSPRRRRHRVFVPVSPLELTCSAFGRLLCVDFFCDDARRACPCARL